MECTCGVKEKVKDGSIKSSSPDEDFFQHAPTSCIHKTNEKEYDFGKCSFFVKKNFFFFNYSMIQKQLSDLSSRLDNLEGSLRKDIHAILDILHHQHQQHHASHLHQQPQSHSHHSSIHIATSR